MVGAIEALDEGLNLLNSPDIIKQIVLPIRLIFVQFSSNTGVMKNGQFPKGGDRLSLFS